MQADQADRKVSADALRGLLPFFQPYLWPLAAAVVLAVQGATLPLMLFLFVGNLLILIRWRGAFNVGSDFMTLVGLSGLLIAHAVGAWLAP